MCYYNILCSKQNSLITILYSIYKYNKWCFYFKMRFVICISYNHTKWQPYKDNWSIGYNVYDWQLRVYEKMFIWAKSLENSLRFNIDVNAMQVLPVAWQITAHSVYSPRDKATHHPKITMNELFLNILISHGPCGVHSERIALEIIYLNNNAGDIVWTHRSRRGHTLLVSSRLWHKLQRGGNGSYWSRSGRANWSADGGSQLTAH